ncbi:hypothetical protein [Helicobacter brantae]|uniref:CAAX protease n=1 Tax=Helicobacter brantae TaxID=375927 RepID=A0A3D8IVW6_9HELI|nr:hypothetical protein [Helicobacter brantae]RDU69362.1 hypothetical protein CQA58_07270 [Helicobacter brantae]
MLKIPSEKLKEFDTDIVAILSAKRLESYEGDLDKHFDNLNLAQKIVKRLSVLEIYLRNKLDFCLKEMIGEEWIKTKESLEIIKEKSNLSILDLHSHQILSSLMFGEIVRLINFYKIEHYMLDLRSMDFKKYHWSNRNFFYINGKKNKLSNVEKVNTALNLIRTIRNRAFHWENLLKVTIKDNGEIFPRITHKERGSTLGVMPDKILVFLDDLLNTIDNDVIRKNV